MRIVNIHEAKTHRSRLVERAANGEPFVIAKAGKPLVKVTALEVPVAGQVRRLGFMEGQTSSRSIRTRSSLPRRVRCLVSARSFSDDRDFAPAVSLGWSGLPPPPWRRFSCSRRYRFSA
jgi:prevent-host-death family protein